MRLADAPIFGRHSRAQLATVLFRNDAHPNWTDAPRPVRVMGAKTIWSGASAARAAARHVRCGGGIFMVVANAVIFRTLSNVIKCGGNKRTKRYGIPNRVTKII